MTRKVMFQGTSSGVGKTLLTAGVCRYLKRQGRDVAPYKTLNLSLNSFVTADGGEIGISQAFQAWACGIEPTVDMNPVLLKPKGEGGLQVILKGRPYVDVNRERGIGREVFLEAIDDCFGRLSAKHDNVILEGSGSPAEINLRKHEVANMTTAQRTASPVILIGDIEKGGVFAALYGTYFLLPEEHRRLVKGFVINRFRGDDSILGKGIERLEKEMGVPCLGVLPYLRMRFPEEDSLSMSTGCSGTGDDIRKVWMANLDRFVDEALSHMDLALLEKIMDDGDEELAPGGHPEHLELFPVHHLGVDGDRGLAPEHDVRVGEKFHLLEDVRYLRSLGQPDDCRASLDVPRSLRYRSSCHRYALPSNQLGGDFRFAKTKIEESHEHD